MKIGDLVKIVHNVHDHNMPVSKTGMIVEFTGQQKDQVLIMFDSFETLKFHVSQIASVISKV